MSELFTSEELQAFSLRIDAIEARQAKIAEQHAAATTRAALSPLHAAVSGEQTFELITDALSFDELWTLEGAAQGCDICGENAELHLASCPEADEWSSTELPIDPEQAGDEDECQCDHTGPCDREGHAFAYTANEWHLAEEIGTQYEQPMFHSVRGPWPKNAA